MNGAIGPPTRGSLPPRGAPVRFAEFTLDLDGCSLSDTKGGDIPLTRSEFAMLREFVRHPGRVLSREYLLNAVAGKRRDPFDRSIDVLIGRLRRKIELNAKLPRFIVTVPGEGYKFVAAIKAEAFKSILDGVAPSSTVSPPNKQDTPHLSIVVLPFANLSGAAEQEHFADGITDLLTTDLSRMHGVVVIARNTAFAYKGKSIDVRKIGRELDARYVLEGSVQRGANRLRVNVQLVDAETGIGLWSERFDMPITELFEMQDEVTARLANQLTVAIIEFEAQRTSSAIEPTSMDLAFQGIARIRRAEGTYQKAFNVARELLERAIALDPMNVRAIAGLGIVDAMIVFSGMTDNPAPHIAAAEAFFERALEIAPGHAFARQWMGILLSSTKRVERGVAELEHALFLDPNLAAARAQLGLVQMFIGRAEKAESRLIEALRLSPRDMLAPVWLLNMGTSKALLGRHEEALTWFDRSIESNRRAWMPHFLSAACLAHLSRIEEAKNSVKKGLLLQPTFSVGRFRALAFSDNEVYLGQREHIYEGFRLAGVPDR
jgi:TolB-like protein/tetratricopeptide (TPR) repeat protein